VAYPMNVNTSCVIKVLVEPFFYFVKKTIELAIQNLMMLCNITK